MTSKKIAAVALLVATMLVLVATPAFAEKGATSSPRNINNHHIKEEDNTQTFNITPTPCGQEYSAWWDPTSVALSLGQTSDQWNIAWQYPSAVCSLTIEEVNSLIEDKTYWTSEDVVSYNYEDTSGTWYTIYDCCQPGQNDYYTAGDSLEAQETAYWASGSTEFYQNAPIVDWTA